ncbi:MAG: type II secretion system F family protein [Dehalococcoidia bacterium]|nr:type II secretion system F family protein [Dehalococcoidia bacterium]
MDPLALAAALSVMVTVVMVFAVFYMTSIAGSNKRVVNRLEHVVNRSPLEGLTTVSALKQTGGGLFPTLGSLLTGKEWANKVNIDLERANLKLRVGEYLALRVAIALVVLAVVIFVAGRGGLGLVAGIAAALVGYMLPKMYLRRRIKARLTTFDEQLVEALSLVSNALRSGFGFLQSMDLAAEQLNDPLAIEFKRTINDINVGASFEDALLALNQRVESKDLDIVVTAILIQRTVGGNLAEILETVAYTMRDRSRIKGELRTLTAQQKMSGYIVGGLPIFIIGILLLMGKLMGDTYMQTLFTETAGRVALMAAVLLEGLGIMIIRKILAIEV